MLTTLNQILNGYKLSDGNIISLDTLFDRQNEYYKRNNLANITKVNDLTEATELAQLLKSIDIGFLELLIQNDNQLKNAFLDTAYGSYLEMLASEYRLNRMIGSNAIGTVWVFTSSKPNKKIIIPKGTQFVTSNKIRLIDEVKDTINDESKNKISNLTFLSTEERVIETNSLVNKYGFNYGVEVPITSEAIGYIYNVDPYSINHIVTDYIDINVDNTISCVNIDKTFNGKDDENDNYFRLRVLETKKINQMGTFNYYKNLIKNSSESISDVDLFITNKDEDSNYFLFNVYLKLYYPDILYDIHNQINDNLEFLERQKILLQIKEKLENQSNILLNHKFNDTETECVKFADSNRFFISIKYDGVDISLIERSFVYDLSKSISSFFRGKIQSNVTVNNQAIYQGYKINETLYDVPYNDKTPNTNSLYNFLEQYSYFNQIKNISFINIDTPTKLSAYPNLPNNDGVIETRWTNYTYEKTESDSTVTGGSTDKVPLDEAYDSFNPYCIDVPYIWSNYNSNEPNLKEYNLPTVFLWTG